MIDTAEVFFEFEVEEGADRQTLARQIQERFQSSGLVQEAEATPQEVQLTGVEIVAGIALGVAIVKGSREFTEELTKLIAAAQELVIEIKELRTGLVEVGDEKVPLGQMDDAKVQTLAEES